MLSLLVFAAALIAAEPTAAQIVSTPAPLDQPASQAAEPSPANAEDDAGLSPEDLDDEAAPTPEHARERGALADPPAPQTALPLDQSEIGHFNPPVLGVAGAPLR